MLKFSCLCCLQAYVSFKSRYILFSFYHQSFHKPALSPHYHSTLLLPEKEKNLAITRAQTHEVYSEPK